MNKFLILAALTGCLLLVITTSPAAAQAADQKMREINVTTDSVPGWLPSVELEATALQTVEKFFDLNDDGDYQASYAMLNPGTRALINFEDFRKDNASFRAEAGKLLRRHIIKTTWTKDPANAPSPGIYAAIDATATFQGVGRQCGYVILYQSPQGGPFSVMRTESNYIANTSAKEIERNQSRAALDRLWAGLSGNCPNFQVLPPAPASSPRT